MKNTPIRKTLVYVFVLMLSVGNVQKSALASAVEAFPSLGACPYLSTIASGGEMILGLLQEMKYQKEIKETRTSGMASFLEEFRDLSKKVYEIKSGMASGRLNVLDELRQLEKEYLRLKNTLQLEMRTIRDKSTRALYKELIELINVHLGMINSMERKLGGKAGASSALIVVSSKLEQARKEVLLSAKIEGQGSRLKGQENPNPLLVHFLPLDPCPLTLLLDWRSSVASSDVWPGGAA